MYIERHIIKKGLPAHKHAVISKNKKNLKQKHYCTHVSIFATKEKDGCQVAKKNSFDSLLKQQTFSSCK